MQEYSYQKSKLVESGLYKYKWHDCIDGNIILELISNGADYYYPSNFHFQFLSMLRLIGFTAISDDGKTITGSAADESFPLVKSLDGCNDDSVRKFPKSDLEKGWIISNEYKFYIPPTCQTFVSLGSHCNCLSTTTDWQFSIEKGNPKTLYYLYLLHIQKPSLAFPKAVFFVSKPFQGWRQKEEGSQVFTSVNV